MKKIIFTFLFAFSTLSSAGPPLEGWMPTTLVKGPDWRLFQIYGKALPFKQVQLACQHVELATKKEGGNAFAGCAQISYALGTCHYIYELGNEDALEHERRHCAGLDHLDPRYVTEVSMQETWNNYQKQLQAATDNLIKQGLSKEKARAKVIQASERQALALIQKYNLPVTPLDAKASQWTVEYNSTEWYISK